MLRISKKLMFAIEAVLDIAYNAGSEPVQSGEITRRQGIPKRYLEQVRGPRGGYRLARERRRINIGEIVRVVRAMETASDPVEEPTGSILGLKVVRPIWMQLQDDCMARLDEITIEDLCLRANQVGIESESHSKIDFSI